MQASPVAWPSSHLTPPHSARGSRTAPRRDPRWRRGRGSPGAGSRPPRPADPGPVPSCPPPQGEPRGGSGGRGAGCGGRRVSVWMRPAADSVHREQRHGQSHAVNRNTTPVPSPDFAKPPRQPLLPIGSGAVRGTGRRADRVHVRGGRGSGRSPAPRRPCPAPAGRGLRLAAPHAQQAVEDVGAEGSGGGSGGGDGRGGGPRGSCARHAGGWEGGDRFGSGRWWVVGRRSLCRHAPGRASPAEDGT